MKLLFSKKALPKIGATIFVLLKSYPSEILLGILLYIRLFFGDTEEGIQFPIYSLATTCFLTAVTYFLGQFSNKAIRLLYFLMPLVKLLVPVLPKEMDYYLGHWDGYTLLMIYALSAIIVCLRGRSKDNLSFSARIVFTIESIAYTIFIMGVFVLGLLAVFASTYYLFELPSWQIVSYIIWLPAIVGSILSFCYFNERAQNREVGNSRILTWLINFALAPSTILYAVILHVYILMILFSFELPRGKVGYMVISFTMVALLGRIINTCTQNNKAFSWFYLRLSFFSVLPLVLFWVGTLYRINQYGFTELRIYLIALGSVITMFVLGDIFFRRHSYWLFLVTTSSILCILVFMPYTNARYLGVKMQESRMINLARQLGAWDDSKQQFKPVVLPYSPLYWEMAEAYNYVNRATDWKGTEMYGQHVPRYSVFDTDDEPKTIEYEFHYTSNGGVIPIKGYRAISPLSYYQDNFGYYIDEEDLMFRVYYSARDKSDDQSHGKGRLVLEVDLKEHVKDLLSTKINTANNSTLGDKKAQSTDVSESVAVSGDLPVEKTVLQNDSVAVVLTYITVRLDEQNKVTSANTKIQPVLLFKHSVAEEIKK